jgi:glucokinase
MLPHRQALLESSKLVPLRRLSACEKVLDPPPRERLLLGPGTGTGIAGLSSVEARESLVRSSKLLAQPVDLGSEVM